MIDMACECFGLWFLTNQHGDVPLEYSRDGDLGYWVMY